MNVAYIITAYKNARQLARLVRALATPTTAFFVHVDRATPYRCYWQMRQALETQDTQSNVRILERYRTPWGGFGIIKALLAGLAAAADTRGRPFDYFVCLSAQDYPIRSNAEISHQLTQSGGKSFMVYWPLPFSQWKDGGLERFEYRHFTGDWFHVPVEGRLGLRLRGGMGAAARRAFRGLNGILPRKRPFLKGFKPFGGGAKWWLARPHAEYALAFVREKPWYLRYFRHVKIPDEMFVHTLLLNSPFAKEIVNDDLIYTDWRGGGSHPKTLRHEDLGRMMESGKLVARKFDDYVDSEILDMLDAFRDQREA